MRNPARFVSGVPSVFCVGAVQQIVAEPVAAAGTVMENAARDRGTVPSLTEITMFDVVPASPAAGVPESVPSVVLNDAHEGLLVMLKVSLSRSSSEAVGLKRYALARAARGA